MTIATRIKLAADNQIFLGYIRQTRYLLFKKEPLSIKFLLLTPEIEAILIHRNGELTVRHTPPNSTLLNLVSLIKESCVLLKKKLLLKGLGFKITCSTNKQTLTFKLGYSHLVSLGVPCGVSLVKIGKNYLIFSGFDSSLLGNFITAIQRLRFPDVYKGKGFWKKYEKKTLKLFKKK
jgi:hypothetical protein